MLFPIRELRRIVVVGVVMLLTPITSFAGWMSFRNDTKDTIVIQEIFVGPNGQQKLGKAQSLAMGEAVRDTMFGNGNTRRIQILDPNNPGQPIYSGVFKCPNPTENLLYSIKKDDKGKITIEVLSTPARK